MYDVIWLSKFDEINFAVNNIWFLDELNCHFFATPSPLPLLSLPKILNSKQKWSHKCCWYAQNLYNYSVVFFFVAEGGSNQYGWARCQDEGEFVRKILYNSNH